MYVLYKYDEDHFKLTVQKEHKNVKESNVVLYSENEDNDVCKITTTSAEELRRIQISRTKRMIYEYCFCNDFKFFGTMTISPDTCNRFSLNDVFKLLRKTINQMKNAYEWKQKDFRYLIICEKHKKGGYHFHGLFSDVLKNDLYINDNLYLSSNYFDRLGFNSWSLIENKQACSCYIQKYITKDFITSCGGTSYICSRGLKRAESYIIDDLCDYNAFVKYDYDGEFCKIKNINLYNNPDDTFYLSFVVKYKDDYSKDYVKATAKEFIEIVKKLLTKNKTNDKLIIT